MVSLLSQGSKLTDLRIPANELHQSKRLFLDNILAGLIRLHCVYRAGILNTQWRSERERRTRVVQTVQLNEAIGTNGVCFGN
jgi:hypothetical protein